MSKKSYACFDIGGTAIKYGVLSEDAEIQFSSSMPTEAYKGPEKWMMNVVQAIKDMQSRQVIDGVCISSAGMIDPYQGTVVFALPQIPDYTGFGIRQFMEEHCGLPCQVENDVNSMVLAESVLGSGKGFSTVLGLAIGTGVGGGFTDHGRLLRGSSFSALEVGYLPVGDSDLEHRASATALCRRVEGLKSEASGSWNGLRVFRAAEDGDSDCIRAIDEMADSIAQGMGMLSYILNPSVIVLGGGVMEQGGLIERIKARYPLYVKPIMAERTAIRAARYGNEAGMVGALIHFLQMDRAASAIGN